MQHGMTPNRKRVGNFEVFLDQKLGAGSFGQVYKARNLRTEEPAAAKHLKINMQIPNNRQMIRSEVEAMKQTYWPHLVDLRHHALDSDNTFWIIVEFCNHGDIQTYFSRFNPSLPERVNFMVQIASAIRYLHMSRIIHRDIKPENVLVKSSGKQGQPLLKVADFGLAKIFDIKVRRMDFSEVMIGTPLFMAPELFINRLLSNEAVDIFALGLTFLAMVRFKREKGKQLYPFADGLLLGQRMAKKAGNDNYAYVADSIQKSKIKIKGDATEKQIRELIFKMTYFSSHRRLAAHSVYHDIKKIFSIFQETLPLAEPRFFLRRADFVDNVPGSPEEPMEVDPYGGLEVDSCGELQVDSVSPKDAIQKESRPKGSLSFFEYTVQAVSTESGKLTTAATVIPNSWTKTEVKVKVWKMADHEQFWTSHDILIEHTLDLEEAPIGGQVIAVLQNQLLIGVRLESAEWKSHVIAADSCNGEVLRKSHVHPGISNPSFCSDKKQVLLPNWSSSSITQFDVETFDILNMWNDERVPEPWRVCSNKNRAAVENWNTSISIFKWETVQLSQEVIAVVEFDCVAMQLLPDCTLLAINGDGQWSVWSDGGAPVHTTVLHPPLVSEMMIYESQIIQDPVSGDCFLQEGKEVFDETDNRVIYSAETLLNRLKTGDKSQVDRSLLKLSKTIEC